MAEKMAVKNEFAEQGIITRMWYFHPRDAVKALIYKERICLELLLDANRTKKTILPYAFYSRLPEPKGALTGTFYAHAERNYPMGKYIEVKFDFNGKEKLLVYPVEKEWIGAVNKLFLTDTGFENSGMPKIKLLNSNGNPIYSLDDSDVIFAAILNPKETHVVNLQRHHGGFSMTQLGRYLFMDLNSEMGFLSCGFDKDGRMGHIIGDRVLSYGAEVLAWEGSPSNLKAHILMFVGDPKEILLKLEKEDSEDEGKPPINATLIGFQT